MLKLRYYQEEAVAETYDYLRNNKGKNPCIELPTGSGKTLVIATICRDAVEKWGGRVLVLSHVKELLEQAADKLNNICPGINVGVYSAGLSSRDTTNPVIVAGIQSVYNRPKEFGLFNLIIVDECHLINSDGDGMYTKFISAMREINPGVRVIGLTATPFRMSSGLICGDDKLFSDISYKIGVRELIRDGYLCKLISKGNGKTFDDTGLHIHAGEFIESEIEKKVNTESVIFSTVADIIERTKNRNSVLIFTASIKHAKNVQKTLSEQSGEEVGLITGDTSSYERAALIARFKGQNETCGLLEEDKKAIKFLVNVNVLTTGFDAPNVDCIALLRPTASPGLLVQMCGRGFRLDPGKTDCLVLDYAGNIARHGPIDIISPQKNGKEKNTKRIVKECPKCNLWVLSGYSVCPECGYIFPKNDLKENESDTPDGGNIISEDQEEILNVEKTYFSVHTKKGADETTHKTVRVEYQSGLNEYRCEWLCPEHTGWPRQKFEIWWRKRTSIDPPATAEDAVNIALNRGLAITKSITCKRKAGEKYWSITDYELGKIPQLDTEIDYTQPEKTCCDCLNFCEETGKCFMKNVDIFSFDKACCDFIDQSDIPF